MKALYLIGAPGVGKSTTMARILDADGCHSPVEGKVDGYAPLVLTWLMVKLDETSTAVGAAAYLGRFRAEFPGTDALGFAVLPPATRWAEQGSLPPQLYGEGARLCHPRFLLPLHRRGQLTVVHLTARDSTLDERCAGRGSNQAASFRRGTATKARNTWHALAAQGVHVVSVSTDTRTPEQVAAQVLDIRGSAT